MERRSASPLIINHVSEKSVGLRLHSAQPTKSLGKIQSPRACSDHGFAGMTKFLKVIERSRLTAPIITTRDGVFLSSNVNVEQTHRPSTTTRGLHINRWAKTFEAAHNLLVISLWLHDVSNFGSPREYPLDWSIPPSLPRPFWRLLAILERLSPRWKWRR